ncbi:MAG: response regulator [Planctomycetaceae bacterium]|nr:response regulator [Planctomycetaceae bacterium]
MDPGATVFVVDDDAAARESVLALVGLKGVRAKGFACAEEFLAHFNPQMTGCLVVDVRMTGMSGLQLLQQLQARQSTLPAIVITGYADVPMAVKAMQSGALTFLEKPCQDQELWQAIQKALDKDTSQQTLRKQKGEIESRLTTLTEVEVEVLRKLLEGLPNKRIAVDLDIGLRTVELRRSNIMKKMSASSLPELVRMAILIGFLPAEKSA